MVFTFYIGGYFAPSSWVKYKRGELLCYTSDYPIPPQPEQYSSVKLKDDEDWAAIIAFLEVCNWQKQYFSEVCDGIQWELKAKATNIDIKSTGSNAFPIDFENFLSLLNKITVKAGIEIPEQK